MLSPKIFKSRRNSKLELKAKNLVSVPRPSVVDAKPSENECKVLVNLVQEFGQETTFHGMNVMLSPGAGRFER